MSIHHNSQKRFYNGSFTYMVTVNVAQKIPYFREKIFCELWLEELKLCKKLKSFELYGFCLNYDHFHMLIKPNEKFDISKVMQAFKKNVSQDINKAIGLHSEGANSNSRLQRVDIEKYHRQLLKHGKNLYKFPKFQWQKSFYDHVIRGEKDFDNQSNYVIYNFVKHGLPENWKYTSLNFPEFLDMT